MSAWFVLQVILNVIFVGAGLVFWARLNRPAKDDPRLSRGLRLLQSKISILEDLSDRTETQVKQLIRILEQKGKEVQEQVLRAQEQVQRVDVSIQKSLDVSKIFQDKIPHKEIIERQNTIKYVQAARLAHKGMSADEIASKIDIPKSELEFIVKVNKNKLMFSEENLPEWAQGELSEDLMEQASPEIQPDLSQIFENGQSLGATFEGHDSIKEDFKNAIEEIKLKEEKKENSWTNQISEGVSESLSEGVQMAKHKIADLSEKVKSQSEKVLNKAFVIKRDSDEGRDVKSYEFTKLDL